MNNENESDTPQEAVASDALLALVRAGDLPVTQENAEKVKAAYAESLQWNQLLEQARLDFLPDPEGISEGPEVFERWLVDAYRDNFDTEDECRAAIHSVRDAILAG